MADASFLDSLKDKLPKGSTIISAVFLVATMLVQWGGKNQHFADVQAQQEKRLTDVESQVQHELVTKEAVRQLEKANDQRFDDLKEQLKAYHDEEVRYHHGRP